MEGIKKKLGIVARAIVSPLVFAGSLFAAVIGCVYLAFSYVKTGKLFGGEG